ncbi:MAG: hypothetical protein LBR70_05220 [Lactobacillaceae bacterium]|jgi:phage repressor protein C with HTH and peptisase S24 domain|nr:hypothetical protein [Lactobacillaceae bacterium]
MKYEQVWEAVDKLAKINGLTPSGLAKKAGLDATTFNKSKRIRTDGKKRFPSLESINKIIAACNMSFDNFCKLAEVEINDDYKSSIPYTKLSLLEDKGTPPKEAFSLAQWNRIKFPDMKHNLYAIEIDYDTDMPYDAGTTLIISENSEKRRGDKVLVVCKDKTVYIGKFIRRTARSVEIIGANKTKDNDLTIQINNIERINRILWISQ